MSRIQKFRAKVRRHEGGTADVIKHICSSDLHTVHQASESSGRSTIFPSRHSCSIRRCTFSRDKPVLCCHLSQTVQHVAMTFSISPRCDRRFQICRLLCRRVSRLRQYRMAAFQFRCGDHVCRCWSTNVCGWYASNAAGKGSMCSKFRNSKRATFLGEECLLALLVADRRLRA